MEGWGWGGRSRAGKRKERQLGEFDPPPGWRLEYMGNIISLE